MSEFKLDLDLLGLDGAKETYLKLHEHEVGRTHSMYFDLYFDNLDSLELCVFICNLNRIICFQIDIKNLFIKILVPPMIHSLMVLIEDMLPCTNKYMRIK
jgi:hypothetical protein